MISGVPTSLTQQQNIWVGSVSKSGVLASKQSVAGIGLERPTAAGSSDSASVDQLTPKEQQLLRQLQQTDRKVRAHEQAHLSVGADLVRGGPSYAYETGPDSRLYAVGGEVSIDTSPGRTPKETIPKSQHIRAAALAPTDPSAQDLRVAALASQMEVDARMKLTKQQSDESRSSVVDSDGPTSLYRWVDEGEKGGVKIGANLDSFA